MLALNVTSLSCDDLANVNASFVVHLAPARRLEDSQRAIFEWLLSHCDDRQAFSHLLAGCEVKRRDGCMVGSDALYQHISTTTFDKTCHGVVLGQRVVARCRLDRGLTQKSDLSHHRPRARPACSFRDEFLRSACPFILTISINLQALAAHHQAGFIVAARQDDAWQGRAFPIGGGSTAVA
ncbi:hypothetical protein M409DRAFT_60322 [Zasmidium cellare ATCC 36951]|uniref:Uncharacterized protein n=1 Tax=Zasmidium cellare ATCC 36951 TaxID=1080233 RepID=A0A6A6BZ61_ZASCE|nr:uncharacterized protein M409DRAFT_60322 [Zasmidium cellare ATCC 36951]KAF2160071.1 hypothetical protein M409DRAFT_60322 [Zasmidium cellare ATCC 36951]